LKQALVRWLPVLGAVLSTSTPPAPATALAPVDWPAFTRLLNELTPLLVQNKFDSLECFAQLQALTANTHLAAPMHDIGLLVHALRFEEALALLRQLPAPPPMP
jgi:hypothetical protein